MSDSNITILSGSRGLGNEPAATSEHAVKLEHDESTGRSPAFQNRYRESESTGIRTRGYRHTISPEHGRRCAEEEKAEEVNRIGHVDGGITVRVEQARARRLTRRSVSTGKLRGRAPEEAKKQADAVGDVEDAILVAVARQL